MLIGISHCIMDRLCFQKNSKIISIKTHEKSTVEMF